MAFNFSDLQQQIQQSINNQWQIISKMKEWWLDPAKDVQYQIYDPNGNLQTITVPNRAKIVNDVPTILQSQMSKTVYVDQVNGDDNNDGSQARPFKTLQKAVTSVPTGGSCEIVLLSDYTLNFDEIVFIYKRSVNLILNGRTLSTSYGDGSVSSFAKKGIFLIIEALLYITVGDGKIVVPKNNTGKPIEPTSYGLINISGISPNANLFIHIGSLKGGNWCEIYSDSLISVHEWSNSRPGFFSVGIYPHYNRTLYLDDVYCSFINAKGAPFSLYAFIRNDNFTGYIKRGSSTISVNDAVVGIIRDSNGVPRNILSNIVL